MCNASLLCVYLNSLILFFSCLQTKENWESDGEEGDDNDDVLIEVNIPVLPDAVYDPQPDEAPGII